ncbi:MAG: helix-turn-helix domain-containing protein [Chitinivibrionales bacterium]|nr:helix-turn-helix domain-containing protein [Chitinivibrionales bacterium]
MIRVWHFEQQAAIQSDYFSLNGYGIQEPMPRGMVDRPGGTNDFLWMYFHVPVHVGVRRQDIPVPAGTLMVWQVGAHQRYGSRQHSYLHSWLHCTGSLVRHMVLTCGIPLDTPNGGLTSEAFERHLHAMHAECSHQLPPDPRIVENHLRNLAYEVQRVARRDPSAPTIPAGLLEARQYLEAHYWEKITLPRLARIANLSAPHFCTQFRKAFNHSPITYLLRYRLAQAAYLLLDRNARVGEVARRVGIDDVHYFSRVFKRQYGKSPRKMSEVRSGAG